MKLSPRLLFIGSLVNLLYGRTVAATSTKVLTMSSTGFQYRSVNVVEVAELPHGFGISSEIHYVKSF